MESTKIMQGILASVAASLVAWWLVATYAPHRHDTPVRIEPILLPDVDKDRRPHLPRLPHIRQMGEEEIGKIVAGGPTGPDGKTEVVCDLPVSERTKNVGGTDGAGLCVFSSIGHSARYQNEHRLANFQKDMRKEKGGGFPQKVDAMIKKYGPGTLYVQYEGKDPSILKLALKTGRMPGVTYCGKDVHYKGQIAHMVNLVGWSDEADLAVILDNNFIGDKELVWLSRKEFLDRWINGQQGWAVILLANPAPPVPRN